MNYMTPQEAAEKWQICLRQVQYLCSNNRIPGIKKINRRWMIPINAKRPNDLRNDRRKTRGIKEVYHFPLFIYSDHYASNQDLNEDEHELLSAQIMMLQCKFAESIEICRRLTEGSSASYVKFGAFYTNACSYGVLGLYSELMKCMDAMQDICEENPENREDYRLLITDRKSEYSHDPTVFFAIDVEKLSPEAVIAYECMIAESEALLRSTESENPIRMYCALCKHMEDSGIIPAAITLHAAIALMYERIGNTEKKEHHISELCRLSYDRMFLKLISKYSQLARDEFNYYLSDLEPGFVNKIEAIRQNNRKGWMTIYAEIKSQGEFMNHNVDEREIILLLSYGTDNRKIAKIKGISIHRVSEIIKGLCEKLGLKNRAELIRHIEQTDHSNKSGASEMEKTDEKFDNVL